MLRVNLKKANDYAEAAKAAASAIKINPRLVHSIYSTDDINDRLANHVAVVRKQLGDVTALVDAQFEIRHQIGRQNAEHGVNNLLTERKRIDTMENRLRTILAGISGDDDGDTVVETEVAIRARMDAMKARIQTHTYGEDKIVLTGADVAIAAGLKADLLALRRAKEDNKDRVTAINMTHEIVLSDKVIETLRKFDIIA